MNKQYLPAILGFLFGTIGILLLSSLSLVSQTIELISAPFFWPGQKIAELFFGENAGNGSVIALTLFNGVLYALIFMGITRLIQYFRSTKNQKSRLQSS
jgi:hypothetical protein